MTKRRRKRGRKRTKPKQKGRPLEIFDPDEMMLTKHHIIPASRCYRKKDNIAKVVKKYHRLYHMLFFNMTPAEIICWLVKYYWNDQWEHVEEALNQRLKEEEL